MINEKIYKYKYKGKEIEVVEADFSKDQRKPGVRFYYTNRADIIVLNKNLDPHRKNIELHRLVTGRGLRAIRNWKGLIKKWGDDINVMQ